MWSKPLQNLRFPLRIQMCCPRSSAWSKRSTDRAWKWLRWQCAAGWRSSRTDLDDNDVQSSYWMEWVQYHWIETSKDIGDVPSYMFTWFPAYPSLVCPNIGQDRIYWKMYLLTSMPFQHLRCGFCFLGFLFLTHASILPLLCDRNAGSLANNHKYLPALTLPKGIQVRQP